MSPEQLQERRRATGRKGARPDVGTVAVVGLGYVGLPLSLLAASRGYEVIGFDIDEVKVAQLSRREADFLSAEEQQLFKAHTSTLRVTSDERELSKAGTFIVCVPTPVYEDHFPDLGPLESACKIVGGRLKEGALVVVESTVSPGVCEDVALSALEAASGLSRDSFDFAHCPERVNPGDGQYDVRTIPRVIGGLTPRALERAAGLYEYLVEGRILRMQSIKEAEAVKMVENAFRDVNIAFINELAVSFDRAGIDLVNVITGASTKPFGFMPFYPGCGVGGHCIPVDPYYLIRYGEKNGFEHKFLITARRINSGMPRYTVHVLEKALEKKGGKLAGSKIALLGLSYKAGIPDTRESPALEIRAELLRRGAAVASFDPYAPGGSARSIPEALKGSAAALIATDHAQFRFLTPLHFEKSGVSLVVDGRNCLDKDLFVNSSVLYRGIGRT